MGSKKFTFFCVLSVSVVSLMVALLSWPSVPELEFSRTAVLQDQRATAETSKRTEITVSSPIARTLAINMVTMPFLGYGGNEIATLAREEEYKVSLRKNLAHPLVQRVHFLTTNSTDTQVRFKEFTSNSKLVIYEAKSLAKTRDVFEYVSQTLLHKDAMVVNGDIYLGGGFDKIDAAAMDQHNVVYALSRYPAPEHVKCAKKDKYHGSRDMCKEYIGSHDSFLFQLNKPLTEEFLQHMDFHYPKAGMEGRMIWAFESVLKYCVLNPCSILKTFHYHCSHLRNYQLSDRVNGTEHYTARYPSKNLYCSIHHSH
jgi:hypothetical protein